MKHAVVFNYNRKCILKKLPENKHFQIFLLNMRMNFHSKQNGGTKSSQRNNWVDWLT